MNTVKQVVILSAELSTLNNNENLRRTNLLEAMLQDVKMTFSPALGVYKNNPENSFVVIVNTQEDIDTLKSFAFKNFGQESILYQDSNQEAYLITNNSETIQLGRLENVSREVALSKEAYTFTNNQFYTVLPRVS